MHGGATSLAADGSGLMGWIVLAVVGLAVGGIIFAFARRGEKRSSEPPTVPVAVTRAGAGDINLAPAGAGAAIPEQPSSDDPIEPLTAGDALRGLQSALQGRRLWATVGSDTSDESVVLITSGQCEEPAMQDAIRDSNADLVRAGFSLLKCVAQHGTEVFQQRL